jgi:predicted nuclease with RNAse H fold
MNSVFYIGFDPGGVGTFGWAVAESKATRTPRIIAIGKAPNAKIAVDTAISFVDASSHLAAVGIDAPLFWSSTGVRRADATVRREMHRLGCLSPGGTVQQLNSLRGACLVQGVTAAVLIRARAPDVLVTETHPKALLWLLGLASSERAARDVRLPELAPYITTDVPEVSEHERDAVISCIAAAAFHKRTPGWTDLAEGEPERVDVVPGTVGYWIPNPA